MLQRANAKVKARHDKHYIPHSFQIGDQVWLHEKKERFTDLYEKMKPLQYGPYSILKHIGENNFQLNIHTCLGLHPVFNVDLLRPYHAPLLEQTDLQIVEPSIQMFRNLFFVTPLWDDAYAIQRRTPFPCFKVAKAGQLPAQGKWYSTTSFLT